MEIKAFSKRIYLSSPTMHGDEMLYMNKAYETNWMSTVGENINEVERLVCEYTGCAHAVALSSGTAALHLAMKLAGVKRGDRVFCTDMTFAATVNPVVYEGGIPVFIDSERDTWNMDPVALEKAFSLYPDVKVVVVVNLYGTPAKLDEICAICKKHGAVLVEDAAESFGAVYKGRQTGSFGTYNVISFNGNKIITGSAGGVLISDDGNAIERARKWSTQSREDVPWYQHTELGYNYRMSNVVAGVVRGQMPYVEKHIAQKKAIYERYREGLKDLPVTVNPYDSENSVPNFWLSCLLINEGAMCPQHRTDVGTVYTPEKGKSCPDMIVERLAQYNVEARPIWKPMHLQPLYKDCVFVTANGEGRNVPNVDTDIFNRGLCLPSDNKMTAEEQDLVIELIKSCFEGV